MPVLCCQKPSRHFVLSLDDGRVSSDVLHPLLTLLVLPFPCHHLAPGCLPAVIVSTLFHRFCISIFLAWPLIVVWWCFPWEFGCSLPLKYQRASAPLIITGICSSSSGLCEAGGKRKNQNLLSKPLEL